MIRNIPTPRRDYSKEEEAQRGAGTGSCREQEDEYYWRPPAVWADAGGGEVQVGDVVADGFSFLRREQGFSEDGSVNLRSINNWVAR